jgi:hypothetical protein
MLMPAFHRFPNEAAIIGRLLAGYGEIDFTFAVLAAKILGDEETVMRAIFRIRGEAARIDLADAIISSRLRGSQLDNYVYSLECVRHCRAIRNQYAHCHWNDDDTLGLFFTNLEVAAEKPSGFDRRWRHVDLTLLTAQEDFFIHTRRCLWHVTGAWLKRKRRPLPYLWPMPKTIQKPNKHNPPEKHPAPWSTEVPAPPPKARPRTRKASSRKS